METTAKNIVDQIYGVLATYGLSVVGAIVLLILGWVAAGWAQRAVAGMLRRSGKTDETLQGFLGSLARYTVITVTVLAVLAQFGIQTASLIAVFGAAGLAVGLALQGTLSNVAAGVMLLLFRPFRAGQFVQVAGQAGTVKSISLFLTELATPDNVQILVPNGQVWGSAVVNFSHHETRRIDLVMSIAYGDAIGKAMDACHAVLGSDDRVLGDPEPMVAVAELADSSVNLTVRFWCNGGDYWPLKFDMTKNLKERFDADGLTIPFPQQDVNMSQVGA